MRIARTVAPGLATDRVEETLHWLRIALAAGPVREALRRPDRPADVTVERELPFLVRNGDVLMEGVVDRLVLLREDGEVVAARILGYKTDAMEPEDAASLQDRIRHYAPQINAYRRAVSGLYGLDPAQVEGGLVFLDAGMVLEVPAADSPSPR